MKPFKLILFLNFISCNPNSTTSTTSLIISNYNKPSNPGEPPSPLPHPYAYYSCFNFIFDTNDRVFFYQHFYDKTKKPVRVIDFDSNAPVFINLNPNQIVEIPQNAIESFIKQNILKVDDTYRTVKVIGVTDTIKSSSIEPLLKALGDTSTHIKYSVRKTTLEENVVLSYKKRQEFYYPDKVNWDSTKVLFDRKRME